MIINALYQLIHKSDILFHPVVILDFRFSILDPVGDRNRNIDHFIFQLCTTFRLGIHPSALLREGAFISNS